MSADSVKTNPRKRKSRDFFVPNRERRKWRTRIANKKDEENKYLLTLVKAGQHVFTLDDPTHNTPFRTTDLLLKNGVEVTALSCDPNILNHKPHPKLTLVNEYTTAFLKRVPKNKKKPHLIWLDYCGSVRRSQIDWVEDLSSALQWLHKDGIIMLTFSKRGVCNYMSFAIQQIRATGAFFLDVYEYQGENNAAMCAFTVAKRQLKIQTLSEYMTPQPDQRVRVTDTTGAWEGIVLYTYTPKEFVVRWEDEEFTVYDHEITHVE